MDIISQGEQTPPIKEAYLAHTKRITEEIIKDMDNGKIPVLTVSQFCSDIEHLPLSEMSFYDKDSGEKLTPVWSMVSWYQSGQRISRTDQVLAVDAANRFIDGVGKKHSEVQAQYGPFSRYVDLGEAIKDSLPPGTEESNKKLFAENPDLDVFLKKVSKVAIPNLIMAKSIKKHIEDNYQLKK